MKLSILIATLGHRRQKFVKLVNHLATLSKPYRGKIEIVAYWNNGEQSIGQIRQALLEAATGDYICFIDDDDWVPDYYIDEIMANLGEDYIGFEVALFNNGNRMPKVRHSLEYASWNQDDEGYYRNVTHLNPIRRELALLGDFRRVGAGEDGHWAIQVAPSVKTQKYIDRIMYYYYHSSMDSSFSGREPEWPLETKPVHIRQPIKHKCFRYLEN